MSNIYVNVDDNNNIISPPQYRENLIWSDVRINPDGGYCIKEYIDNPPQYDPTTQNLIKSGYVMDIQTATVQYQIESKSNAEIAKIQFQTAISAGFDTGMGFKLKLFDADKSAFSEWTTLLDKSLQYQILTTSSLFPIKDYDNNLIYMSASQYYPLAIQYGLYYSNLWATYNSASNS